MDKSKQDKKYPSLLPPLPYCVTMKLSRRARWWWVDEGTDKSDRLALSTVVSDSDSEIGGCQSDREECGKGGHCFSG